MPESALEISKIHLPEYGKFEVKIKDEYFLHLKDADCVRTILYENTGEKAQPIILPTIKHAFFPTCENFALEIDGKDQTHLLKESELYYSKVVNIDLSKELSPEEKLEIKISCKWKNFVSSIDDSYFMFSYPEKAMYRLILHGLNPRDKLHLFYIGERKALLDEDYHITEDAVFFKELGISKNDPLKIKLLILSTPKVLPMLNYFLTRNKEDLSAYLIILIQHLLSDFVHLVNAFHNCGTDKNRIFIVGIPYSTKDKTVKYLKSEGYNNLRIPFAYPFDEYVELTMKETIQISKSTGKKILIVEDGGYAVPLLHKVFINEANQFVGAIEQTANGIWRDEDILKKDGINYCIPIVDVARSEIKLKLESPLIGRAVCRNIELLLGRQFFEISGKNVGIVGFGSTGSRIAKTLKDIGADVTIFSDNKIDLIFARKEGYRTAKTAKELISICTIIIEATGNVWAGAGEISSFQNNSYFVSASSKKLGLDYKEFEALIDRDKINNLPGIGVKYLLLNSRNHVTLLANGYPVNFFDSESVPDKEIQFIPTILFESAKVLSRNKDTMPKGIIGFKKDEKDSGQILKIKEELLQLQNDIANFLDFGVSQGDR